MPQFTEFPHLPSEGTAALVACFADMPSEGEPFKAFRRRLKNAGLWSRERLDVLMRFLRMATGDVVVPSPLVRALQGDGADKALADRLWAVNPLLLATVYERLTERVHSSNELLKYIDSFAYPGTRIPGPELRAWLRIADGLGLFKTVGIRLGLSEQAEAWFARRIERFDLEEFLEDDQDEAEPVAPAFATGTPTPAPVEAVRPAPAAQVAPSTQAAPTPAVQAPVIAAPPPQAAAADWSPLLDGTGPALKAFATSAIFDDAVRAETVERMAAWWGRRETRSAGPSAADFGINAESFRDDPMGGLFHLAVAARLRFSTADAVSAFMALRDTGVLDALHGGAPPSGPLTVDAGALLSASLIARRLAEQPDLAGELEAARDADAVFDRLAAAFDGLFGLELFWMVRVLAALGAIRRTGAAAYGSLPTRALRDTLFRLGFLATPYAPDTAALRAAARAAAPFGAGADAQLSAFAQASGCAWACPHRARCTVACRERADRP